MRPKLAVLVLVGIVVLGVLNHLIVLPSLSQVLDACGIALIVIVVIVAAIGLLGGPKKLNEEEELQRRRKVEAEANAKGEPLRTEQLKPKSLSIEKTFLAHSPAHFVVEYGLRLVLETTEGEFQKAKLGEQETQTLIAELYNQDVFLKFLHDKSYRFHLGWNKAASAGQTDEEFAGKADIFREEAGEKFFRDVTSNELAEKLRDQALTKNGCRVSIKEIVQNLFSEKVIEGNYTMLTKGQREESERDKRYRKFDEILTVAALKRRLEFYQAQHRQKYDSLFVSIATERIGRGLKISWQFKKNAPARFDLVGFRKTGGFFPDEFDQNNNGTLVMQSQTDNYTTEFLKENETYFYTFYLKAFKHEDRTRYSVARFQITLTADETTHIEGTIRRIEEKEAEMKARLRAEVMAEPPKKAEEKTIDPAYKNIFEALKQIFSTVELQNAMDEMEKALAGQVKAKGLSKEEENQKLENIHEAVAQQRDKYLS